jgi:hypothetical protein
MKQLEAGSKNACFILVFCLAYPSNLLGYSTETTIDFQVIAEHIPQKAKLFIKKTYSFFKYIL